MNDWDGPDRDLAKVPPGLPDAPVRQTSQVALWMVGHGYATDDADTLDDLLGKLVHQVHANALLEAHFLRQKHGDTEEIAKYRARYLALILSYAKKKAVIELNVLDSFERLYKSDRSEMLWPDELVSKFLEVAEPRAPR